MKFIIAPASFKESLTAQDAAQSIYYSFHMQFPQAEIELVPMADGGEGSLESLKNAMDLRFHTVPVHDPLLRSHTAKFATTGDLALIEIAQSAGLNLIALPERNPLLANSYGTGEVIFAALDAGYRKFIIFLGGSATCDAGMGLLAALGAEFKNALGVNLSPSGNALSEVHSVDTSKLDPRLKQAEFILAHDVNNMLLGLDGALMYAPQKGATLEHIEILHKGYEQFAYVLQKQTGKNLNIPGLGAAGGMGAVLYAFCNCQLVSGGTFIFDKLNLLEKMQGADLLITGEGQIDAQTSYGKAMMILAQAAKNLSIPVIAFTGNMQAGYETVYNAGIDAVFSISLGPQSKEESLAIAKSALVQVSNNVAKLLKLRILL